MPFLVLCAWRYLEHEYHFRVQSYILNFVDENEWPIDGINKIEVLQSLADLLPVAIMDQCFSWYAEKTTLANESRISGSRHIFLISCFSSCHKEFCYI